MRLLTCNVIVFKNAEESSNLHLGIDLYVVIGKYDWKVEYDGHPI